MRVQCCICTDLLEADSVPTAVTCGHVFHKVCLMQWVGTNTKATCPECRKPINVKKDILPQLYFNQADVEPDEVDPNKLKNDLDSARLGLRTKEKEKQDLRSECKLKERQLEEANVSIEKVRSLYEGEKALSKSLKKELASFQSQIKEAQLAKEDAKRVRVKLQELQAIQNLVKGSEYEADEIIQSHGDSKSLAIWCAILKRELSEKKRETRVLREEHEKFKRDSVTKQKVVDERNRQLAATKEKLKQVEEDLNGADKIIISQKRRIESLLQTMDSPGGTPVSVRHRLIAESPAPRLVSPEMKSPTRKKPRLSVDASGDVDLDLSMDLFPDSDTNTRETSHRHATESPSVGVKKQCKDYGTKYVKITSAAGKSSKEDSLSKRELNDIGNIAPAGFNFNILKKKTGFGLNSGYQSGAIKKGYNGLGSHEKFVQPQYSGIMRNKALVKKTSGSKLMNGKTESGLNRKAPPLPNLSGFLT